MLLMFALLACAPTEPETTDDICVLANCRPLQVAATIERFVQGDEEQAYPLYGLPVEGSLDVSVREGEVHYPFVEGSDYLWDPIPNAVQFDRYIPSPGAVVVIRYQTEDQVMEEDMSATGCGDLCFTR